MKKILTISIVLIIAVSTLAQSPDKISYQAVIRDLQNNLVTEQTVGMQFSLLQGSVDGSAVYVETHTPTTNVNGLISINIGEGVVQSGDFSAIDWANGPYFIRIETDPEGGTLYTITGVNQLLSVPYALYAKTAESISGGFTETDPIFTQSQASNISANDIANLQNLSGINTGDQDLSGIATLDALNDSIIHLRAELPDVSGIAINTQAIQDTANQLRTDMVKQEADPFFNTSIAKSITAIDTARWNSKIDSYTETDPRVPIGTQSGQMQYWNGTEWVTIAPGINESVLTFIDGMPMWVLELEDGEVRNPVTGRIWLDKNLGAIKIADSIDDVNAYGDLYQWGRLSDGHEFRNSNISTMLSSVDVPGHADFISVSGSPYDWRESQNDALWQGLNGINNPCPEGYRLPTEAEWQEEVNEWTSLDYNGALNSVLKLPAAGFRVYDGGIIYGAGEGGSYWTSTVDGSSSRGLYYSDSYAQFGTDVRADGASVRCVKD